jgi:hypothetical protein
VRYKMSRDCSRPDDEMVFSEPWRKLAFRKRAFQSRDREISERE